MIVRIRQPLYPGTTVSAVHFPEGRWWFCAHPAAQNLPDCGMFLRAACEWAGRFELCRGDDDSDQDDLPGESATWLIFTGGSLEVGDFGVHQAVSGVFGDVLSGPHQKKSQPMCAFHTSGLLYKDGLHDLQQLEAELGIHGNGDCAALMLDVEGLFETFKSLLTE